MTDLLNPPGGQPRIDFWPPHIIFGDEDDLTMIRAPKDGQGEETWVGPLDHSDVDDAAIVLACTEGDAERGYTFRVFKDEDGYGVRSYGSLTVLAGEIPGARIEHNTLIVPSIDLVLNHLAVAASDADDEQEARAKAEAEAALARAIADRNKPVKPVFVTEGSSVAAENMMASITRRKPVATLPNDGSKFIPDVVAPLVEPVPNAVTPPWRSPWPTNGSIGALRQMNDMFLAARAVRDNAHAPYSNFKVAAAVLTEGGTIHTGVNVENAAYPQSQCAEASAIGAMLTAGHRRIKAVLVIGGNEGDDMLCAPCGGCRQRIREFADPDTPIHICGPEGIRRSLILDELLPLSFGPDNLNF